MSAASGLATIRFDIRRIATIARFYISKGVTFKNKSDVINQVLYDMETLILSDGSTERFTKTDEAHFFLTNIGMNFKHQTTDKGYLKQLKIETLRFEEDSPDASTNVKEIEAVIKENM